MIFKYARRRPATLFVYCFVITVLAVNILINIKKDFFEANSYSYSHSSGELFINVWPEENPFSDRIFDQLKFSPKNLPPKPVLIYLPHGYAKWNIINEDEIFQTLECKVQNCRLTEKYSDSDSADVVVFHTNLLLEPTPRPKNQIWVMYILENPHNAAEYGHLNNAINYSATYRIDSTFVTPYEKLTYAEEEPHDYLDPDGNLIDIFVDYAEGKTKKVAWFVSNRGLTFNRRNRYVEDLKKIIPVDIYSRRGPGMNCPKTVSGKDACFEMLRREYKFYLSFENANCRDYITEKFFINGLRTDVIPVVMGPSKRDYQKVAPLNSFVHVDDFDSPETLGAYLNYLDKNDTAYNEYFDWKRTGRYEFVNTKFWCRLCALMNDPKPHVYANFQEWWAGDSVCTYE